MLAALLLLGASAHPCAIDHARCVLREDPSVTLAFHVVPKTEDWVTRLTAEMRLRGTG